MTSRRQKKHPHFFCFPFSPLPRFGRAFAHFNEIFLESSALAYLNSQGNYTLVVGSSVCVNSHPRGKKSHHSHRSTVTDLPAVNQGGKRKGKTTKKKEVTFTTYFERERREYIPCYSIKIFQCFENQLLAHMYAFVCTMCIYIACNIYNVYIYCV